MINERKKFKKKVKTDLPYLSFYKKKPETHIFFFGLGWKGRVEDCSRRVSYTDFLHQWGKNPKKQRPVDRVGSFLNVQ
jgi:hypothetical protein